MKKVSSPPRVLTPRVFFTGLSCVLIALLSIACDKNPFASEKHANVVLEGEIIVREGSFSTVQYLGKVKNIGAADAHSTTITFDTYDKDNKLLSVDFDLIIPISLSPGRIASFDVWTDIEYEDYDHHEYRIDWLEH